LRLSFGGIGGYLVCKLVKQTTINSRLAYEYGFDEIGAVEAESEEGTGGARILREADAAMQAEESRFNPSNCIVDQSGKLVSLFIGNRCLQVLDFNQAFADEDK
jgi:hypothetical protein